MPFLIIHTSGATRGWRLVLNTYGYYAFEDVLIPQNFPGDWNLITSPCFSQMSGSLWHRLCGIVDSFSSDYLSLC